MALKAGNLNKVTLKYHEDSRRDLLDEIRQLRNIVKQQDEYIRKIKSAFREYLVYVNTPKAQTAKKLLNSAVIVVSE